MKRRVPFAIVLAAALSMAAGGGAIAGSTPLQLTFEKSVAEPGVWEGTVGGDETGTIVTSLTDVVESGSTWYVTFDWQVGLSGGERIVAEVSGIINLRTGRVVMNGEILDGAFAGSRIHVDAQLDPGDLSSQGTMLITP